MRQPSRYLNESLPAAAWAASDFKYANILILFAGTLDVCLTEIAVEYGVVLIRRRENFVDAESAVAESNVFSSRVFALAPTAFNVEVGVHEV